MLSLHEQAKRHRMCGNYRDALLAYTDHISESCDNSDTRRQFFATCLQFHRRRGLGSIRIPRLKDSEYRCNGNQQFKELLLKTIANSKFLRSISSLAIGNVTTFDLLTLSRFLAVAKQAVFAQVTYFGAFDGQLLTHLLQGVKFLSVTLNKVSLSCRLPISLEGSIVVGPKCTIEGSVTAKAKGCFWDLSGLLNTSSELVVESFGLTILPDRPQVFVEGCREAFLVAMNADVSQWPNFLDNGVRKLYLMSHVGIDQRISYSLDKLLLAHLGGELTEEQVVSVLRPSASTLQVLWLDGIAAPISHALSSFILGCPHLKELVIRNCQLDSKFFTGLLEYLQMRPWHAFGLLGGCHDGEFVEHVKAHYPLKIVLDSFRDWDRLHKRTWPKLP